MRKKLTTAALVKKLDRVFSKFIRMRAADACGTVECVTCMKPAHYTEVHAGHFIKRQHMSTRFDPRNVQVQCVRCNTYQGGRQDDYANWILQNYGHEVFDELMALKRTARKWTREELESEIKRYESLVKDIETKFET